MATGIRPWHAWVAVIALILSAGLSMVSCDDMFVNDGDPDLGIANRLGYYYFVDNEVPRLLMLDHNLEIVGSWSTFSLFDSTRIQGITFDDHKVWLSAAGSYDLIVQIDVSSDTIVVLRSFDAPPLGRGTIRDIAWDGTNLWAVNSGSVTYSVPPTLYKLNPETGAILAEYPMPTPEPRSLTWVQANGDAYNRGAGIGLYYGETAQDQIVYFNTEKFQFDTVFASPEPPSGSYDIFPVGLCFDGADFWLVNSANAGDYLYKLNYQGLVKEEVELSYATPGPMAWSTIDARLADPPSVLAVSPNTGSRGAAFEVDVIGENFKPGAGLEVSFGEGITVSNVNFVDGNNLTADIEIAGDAAFGARNVTVINPDGKTGAGTDLFTVLAIDPLAGYLWMLETAGNLMYRVRIIDTVVVQTWDLSGVAPGSSPQGLTFDGANLWLSAGGTDDRVMKLNTDDADPSIVSWITAPPAAAGTVRELAFVGADLWVANSGTAHVYHVDPTTGAISDSIAAPGPEIRGLASANGNLYCSDRTQDSVYVYDFDAGSWTALFATPTPPGGTTANRYSTGMTFDGANFWIVNSTFEFDYVFQVSLDGVVLRTYPLPLQGDATWSGVAFTQE